MTIPDLFQPIEPSPFGELIGPVYMRTSDSAPPVLGVRVGSHHANRQGRGHGGLLMTLADIAVSRAAWGHVPPGASIATAALQISFLDSVGEGQWLEAVPSIDRLGRSLIHASCVVQADDKAVARVMATIAVRLPMPE